MQYRLRSIRQAVFSRDAPGPVNSVVLAGLAVVGTAAVAGLQAIKAIIDAAQAEITLAMIKPDAFAAGKVADIIKRIEQEGFRIIARKEHSLTGEQVDAFYAEHIGKPFYPALKAFMSSGPLVALALQRVGAIKAWRALMGPTNTATAKAEAPTSLRAQHGTDGTKNATHGSDSPASALRELSFHFPELETTLAMIKPDAVAAGKAGEIKAKIRAAGFKIVHQREYTLTPAQVDEFYAEHRERPFFPALKAFMTSGPVIALALRKTDAIASWRALMGPTSTDAARVSAPTSLRALYGTDNTRNATHGSDSFEAAARELYFHFPPVETTLAMIKPDAVAAGKADEIKAKIRAAGFKIVASTQRKLAPGEVEEFYAEHVGKPFFPALSSFMASGPVLVLALRKRGAIAEWRALMGPTSTDAARASAPASLRALYGTDGTRNATHGSDSHESAARELAFHFPHLAAHRKYWGCSWPTQPPPARLLT